ncbi:MAG: beta-lactamase family protein [Lachnospiraceae bacterium]|nr:beta-lactamase family protein [Lachnospiraceae bacterium]
MKLDIQAFSRKAVPIGVLGLKITQNGEELAYQLWDDECRRNVYSASKSFTSCAVGMAVKEGLLSLNEMLVDAFAEDMPDKISENLAKATVEDLLTMCLGQGRAYLMGEQRPRYREKDWVKMTLGFPFVHEPGSHFLYNNVGPYLAGILVQRRVGCDLVSYLMPRLFEPLDILRPTWECDPLGCTFGAGGLLLTLSELHSFGLLYLNEGKWNGKQLLPADWVFKSSISHTGFDYGYLFWLGEKHSYRADGKYSQLSIVLPRKQAVITVVAECREGEALKRAIFDELYPQL